MGSFLGEEGTEARPNILFAGNGHALKVFCAQLPEKFDHRAFIPREARGLDLAVAEEIADVAQFFGGLECRRIIRIKIIAVRAVKGVDVPHTGMVAVTNNF